MARKKIKLYEMPFEEAGERKATFRVVERQKGLNRVEVIARSLTYLGGEQHQASHYYYLIPKSVEPHSFQEIARAAAVELDDNTGLIFLTEVRDGIPTRLAIFASAPGFGMHHQFCIASTDPKFCPVVNVKKLRQHAAKLERRFQAQVLALHRKEPKRAKVR